MQIGSIQNGHNISREQDIKSKPEELKKIGDFEKLLTEPEKQGQENESKVNEMIEDISKIKEMLDFDLSVENLQEYKNAVRSFLDYYTKNELKMDEYYMRDQKGYQKKLNIIRSVDNKLNDLTENMLETNQGHLNQLKQIGEIHGLLLNLRL